MSAPRIGIDCRFAHGTGIGRYVRGLVNALLQVEKDATFVVIANPQNDPTAVWDWLDGGDAKDEGRLEVAQFSKPVEPYSIAEQAWMPEVARAKKLDLVHVPHWNVGLFSRVPVVASFHDATYLSVDGVAPSRASKWGASFLMRRAAKKVARILVPTKAAEEEVLRFTGADPEKVVQIPLFADEIAGWVERVRRGSCETISPRVRELPRFVLGVGNHLPHKDVPLLVRAFARVKKELGLRELVLALAGPMKRGGDATKAAIEECGATDSVVALGEVMDRDLAYLYDKAACFVTASRNEGFGLCAVEAMAAGTPVVATDIPAHREVLGDAAQLVPPGDEKALAGALGRVLAIEALAKDLSRRGPPRASLYRAERTARETAQVYRSVLGLVARAPAPS